MFYGKEIDKNRFYMVKTIWNDKDVLMWWAIGKDSFKLIWGLDDGSITWNGYYVWFEI